MKDEGRMTDELRLFSEYIALTGIGRVDQPAQGDPALVGNRLGLINAATWITLWCNYFGKLYLPGVQLVNAGNDAVQLNFTRAFNAGEPCPPPSNINAFVRCARDLVELGKVDAILITCSTMNRSYPAVAQAVRVPVVQIDQPMMEAAVQHGGKILVIATLVTTMNSTMALLRETAQQLNQPADCVGITVEEAWHRLSEGDITAHNELLARAIRDAQAREKIDCVVLAQLSMSVFALSYPDPIAKFGVPVFNSGQCGFQRMREILTALPRRED
jgi:aspartate/glutamate racemase